MYYTTDETLLNEGPSAAEHAKRSCEHTDDTPSCDKSFAPAGGIGSHSDSTPNNIKPLEVEGDEEH